ncbi:flagellar biosynthesis anti-sigma factor FlgM [Alkaliphilus hydrothermalis]|uniref:Negative regulator of flagellin synthesis n=1 Tax=Alkaliphilus hydrothermalis TaxID=1482730 RepID=A0ABS2NRA9_9FIRM|nr:flagellar biosynthesis anti-sigma factor FlgM [Alkaliphilus hydrothermalis]MBM7615366.1 negative regulator of flagellin synthesis FlgM [Alkaliphilus hydrothermalis]
MKIYNNPNVTKAMKVYNTNTKKNATETAKGIEQSKDQLQLSEVAKDFQVAMKAFKKLPDIREEKVADIKNRIQQGTYNVSGQEVADKILASLRIDQKI